MKFPCIWGRSSDSHILVNHISGFSRSEYLEKALVTSPNASRYNIIFVQISNVEKTISFANKLMCRLLELLMCDFV